MKKLFLSALIGLATVATGAEAKTLMVYFSFSGNIDKVAEAVKDQTGADLIKIEPAQKGLDYAANYYSLGSDLISKIRSKPNDIKSYPAIDPVKADISQYDFIIIGTPLWWSQMAAPMQTFLFQNEKDFAGKKVGLIVSSASSGISGVESDAKRLLPKADIVSPSLWIRSSKVSSAPKMVGDWLKKIGFVEKK